MRTMMQVEIPVEAGNKGIKDGSLPTTLEALFGEIQPEAVYFLTGEGRRCAFVVFDLTDTSDIPSIAEPLFQNLDARVELSPCMNREELQTGLGKIAK